MSSWVRSFLRLPRRDQHLLVGAYALLLVTELLLSRSWSSIQTIQRLDQRLVRALFPVPRSGLTPTETEWALDTLAPFLPASVTCLRRAIVADAILTHHGHVTTFRIGVRKADDTFTAHAWVEHEGAVVVGDLDDLAQYVPMPTEEAGFGRQFTN